MPLSWMFSLVGLGQASLLAVQRFHWHDPRPAGTFGNPNDLAAWFAAALLFFVCRRVQDRESAFKLMDLLLPLPAAIGLVLTGSRGALVGVAAAFGVVLLFVWQRLKGRPRKIVTAVALLSIVIVAAGVGLRLRDADPYRYQRISIWKSSLAIPLEQPWTGAGPGQFSRLSQRHQFPDGRSALRYDRTYSTTHSDWLRSATDLGWPGVLALAATALAFALSAVRRLRQGRPFRLAPTAMVVGLFVHAAFDNLTRAPAVYLLFATMLGWACSTIGPSRRPVTMVWRWLAMLLLIGLWLGGDLTLWRSWRAAQANQYETALRWNPADASTRMSYAEQLATQSGWPAYLAARQSAERATQLAPNDGTLKRSRARIESAYWRELFPDAENRQRIAELYQGAESLQPTNPFVPMELSAFLLDSGDAAGARRAVERAIQIEPQAARPRLLLARSFLLLGDRDRALETIEEARRLAAAAQAEAQLSDYARDLLSLDAGFVQQLEAALAAPQGETRQRLDNDPRFVEQESSEEN
jgi:tetratricopeptide (TPR) repeat protein